MRKYKITYEARNAVTGTLVRYEEIVETESLDHAEQWASHRMDLNVYYSKLPDSCPKWGTKLKSVTALEDETPVVDQDLPAYPLEAIASTDWYMSLPPNTQIWSKPF